MWSPAQRLMAGGAGGSTSCRGKAVSDCHLGKDAIFYLIEAEIRSRRRLGHPIRKPSYPANARRCCHACVMRVSGRRDPG